MVIKENSPLSYTHQLLGEAGHKPMEETEVQNSYDPILESMMHKGTNDNRAEQERTHGLTIEELSGTGQEFKANVGDQRERVQRKKIPVHHTKYIPPPFCHDLKKIKDKGTFLRSMHSAPRMHIGHHVTGLPFEPG